MSRIFKQCLLLFLIDIVSVTSKENDGGMLPPDWSKMCQSQLRNNVTYISCLVAKGDVWDFGHFRNWSVNLDVLVSLDVTCRSGGSICLPWPYLAHNLDVLKFRHCLVKCYYADYNKPEVLQVPDTLRILEEHNAVIETGISDLLNVKLGRLPPALECGPLNLELYIQRGRKHTFINSSQAKMDDAQITKKLVENVKEIYDVDHKCRYGKMQVYDISQTDDPSVGTLFMVFENSRFPELRTLNLSGRHVMKYPAEVKIYLPNLPKLRTVDLSNNGITRFDLDKNEVRPNMLIDLSNNNIQSVRQEEIHSFKRAMINIGNNPLKCDCSQAKFIDFLRQYSTPAQAGLPVYYTYLWKLTCATPSWRQGQLIADLSRSDLCDGNSADYKLALYIVGGAFITLIVIIVAYCARTFVLKQFSSLCKSRKPVQRNEKSNMAVVQM